MWKQYEVVEQFHSRAENTQKEGHSRNYGPLSGDDCGTVYKAAVFSIPAIINDATTVRMKPYDPYAASFTIVLFFIFCSFVSSPP